MTQAPTPGPLSAEDVKLLVKGDLLRRTDGTVVTLMADGLPDASGGETFIGRPDADGWMIWSGGENPVPGQRVETRLRNGRPAFTETSDDLWWSHDPNSTWPDHHIIAFRLAPTAPVEASGSERVVPVCLEIPLSNHMKVTLEYDPDGSRTAMLWNEANEPIADGDAPVLPLKTDSEVREQIARRVELAIVRHGVEESALEGTLLDADAILALLSARPLAWGGQHSIAHVLSEQDVDQALACSHPNDSALEGQQGEAVTIIRDRLRRIWEGDTHLIYSGNPPEPSHDEEGDLAKLANEAVEALNSLFPVPAALSTTPARAEAQDEGAAGEREAIVEAVKVAMKDAWEDHASDTGCWPADIKRVSDRGPLRLMFVPAIWAQTTAEWAAETILRNRAHPSPTPAADADRVREEALEKIAGYAWPVIVGHDTQVSYGEATGEPYETKFPVAKETALEALERVKAIALAALKSTAAKEGGAK